MEILLKCLQILQSGNFCWLRQCEVPYMIEVSAVFLCVALSLINSIQGALSTNHHIVYGPPIVFLPVRSVGSSIQQNKIDNDLSRNVS